MISPNMLAPSRIEGVKIAAGRATWENEKGKTGYNFPDEDSFGWKLNIDQLKQLEIDEQDLWDCVEQAEKQFGSPDNMMKTMGLLPNQGFVNIGASYVSRTNPRISCVFTPTSVSYATTNPLAADTSPIDAYFEFYYTAESMAKDAQTKVEKFLKDFDKLSGNRVANILNSPIMPSYEEACVFSDGVMQENIREQFLQQVWNYHRNCRSVSYKKHLEENIMEIWNSLNRTRKVLSLYEG